MAKALNTLSPAPVATDPTPAPVSVPNPAPVDAPTDPKVRSARFREAFALSVALTGALGNDADARALRAAHDVLCDSVGCSLSIVGAGVTVTLHGGIGQSSAWRYVIGARDASIGRNALATDLRRKPEARRYSVR
jgi:hypothetical protein